MSVKKKYLKLPYYQMPPSGNWAKNVHLPKNYEKDYEIYRKN